MTHDERMQIFGKINAGCVTDALIHYGVGGWTRGLFPVSASAYVYGRAVTARFDIVTPPRREITPLEVIETSKPGDVLVWNADLETNLIGGNVFTFAKKHGASGIVLEGRHRDSAEIAELGGGVFSRGPSCGCSPVNFKASADTVNVPVTVGGTTVRPGDYVCGDCDGVVVIPVEYVDDVLRQALCHMDWEKNVKNAIARGYTAARMKEVYASGVKLPRTKE
jgi:4-hydroxy-4-methyl-2-oxoglutarate aldolase